MKVMIIFLENVSRLGMEEEFVKLTEVVLKFELRKVFKFKSSYCNNNCFFFGAISRFTLQSFYPPKRPKKRIFTAIGAKLTGMIA
jgi:hypothetical protein